MILKKKQRTIRFQHILLCTFALSTSILGYSYYQQSVRLKAMETAASDSVLSDTSGNDQNMQGKVSAFAGIEVNEELAKLQCNDGLYANLLTRYGMFEYDKFKSKSEHCTVNSPFPIGSGMCLPERL